MAIPSEHEVTHSKVLVNKEHQHYQNELVFRSVDDRLLELREGFPLLQQKRRLIRARAQNSFLPAIGTCLLITTLPANGTHLIFRRTELSKRPSS